MQDIVFLHGWGQDKRAFEPILEVFQHDYKCHVIDLPGFGETPEPDSAWVPGQYADYVASYCEKENIDQAIFIGHSFGGEVSALLAVRHPKIVKALVLIAASGLKKKRSLKFRLKAFSLKILGKLAGLCDKLFVTSYKQAYREKFGSRDYRNAKGVMRDILVKTVNEDISNIAAQIKQKTLLLYAENDNETPPSVGKKYNELIQNSELICYQHQDHYTILNEGRFQVQRKISNFLKDI